jgi:hypothetical protein
VIFWTHRAPKRDIRDPNTLRTIFNIFKSAEHFFFSFSLSKQHDSVISLFSRAHSGLLLYNRAQFVSLKSLTRFASSLNDLKRVTARSSAGTVL